MKILIVFLIGLPILLLCYNRPRNLFRETKFKQALRWSEVGKILFIGQSIFIIGITYYPIVQMALEGSLQSYMVYHDIFLYPSYVGSHPTDIAFITASIFLPLFFAWLTQQKLVKPLREEKVPSLKWFNLLFVMGLSSVFFIEVFIIAKPLIQGWRLPFLYYTPETLLSNILGTTLFFSSLIIGAFCVAVAKYKLRNLVRGIFPL